MNKKVAFPHGPPVRDGEKTKEEEKYSDKEKRFLNNFGYVKVFIHHRKSFFEKFFLLKFGRKKETPKEMKHFSTVLFFEEIGFQIRVISFILFVTNMLTSKQINV